MIIIIGAGLSGLVTAYRLKQAKIPFLILEAKDRTGGRIFTKTTDNQTPIEMGATWFGKQHQNLIGLLNELKVTAFPQYQGDYYYYDDPDSPHHGKYKLPPQEVNYRIEGGSKNLINKLFEKLEKDDIRFSSRVEEIRKEKKELIIKTENNNEFVSEQIILAVPPKIWAHQITFIPSLPQDLLQIAKNTQTWMEDSIKAAVEFEKPFWRENSQPATIMSNSEPFTECYDHTNQKEDKFALCGFLNPGLKNIEAPKRKDLVLKQLANILGEQALHGTSYHEYIWSEDDYVKWPKDSFMHPHQNNGHPIFRQCFLNNQLIIASSESAATFPGYMDGAVEAGERAFDVVNQNFERLKGH
ncbi:NAD(P)/FAD-dependent oxidoreductase [Marivirga sp.]|uniref:flavin monoamine oxidase family protein n=1 Tax=Marivirga sp. TaxID=2018662 RepID=UPI002D7FEE0F|nr:NAD(P)/FAD-dependent oxidoreductase [Marivirga sp.]HET8859981.1 NAD(P)/FAD-dependent oxidoreductase [Marivirga sp.]